MLPGMISNIGVAASGGSTVIELVYSSNTADVNLFTDAGSPEDDVTVNVTVQSGVDVYASSTGIYAMDGNGFSAGTIVNIVVTGRICGKGGAGGTPGASPAIPAGSGGAGGPALRLGCETHITGSGSINGGGGGGGAGGGVRAEAPNAVYAAGGAGGVGQSYNGGPSGGGSGQRADNGSGNVGDSGAGGSGAAFGASGSSGASGTNVAGSTTTFSGAGGGPGGKAIEVNGQTYTNSVTTNGAVS